MDDFTATFTDHGAYVHVKLFGSLIMSTAHMLSDVLNAASAGTGKHCFILDVGALSSTDSSGLAALISAYKTASQNGGYLRLLNMRAGLMETIYITRLEQILPRYKSIEEAVAGPADPGPAPSEPQSPPGS